MGSIPSVGSNLTTRTPIPNHEPVPPVARLAAYNRSVFVETLTAPKDEWERWKERVRMLADPPAALVASIAWDAGDGQVTSVNVWDSPEAVSDFFVSRVHPVVQELGEPSAKPMRHGVPLAVYIRPMV